MKDKIKEILTKYNLKEVFSPNQGTFRLEVLDGESIEDQWISTDAYKEAEAYFKENIEPHMTAWKANSEKYKELQALSEAEFSRIISKHKVQEATSEVEQFCKDNNITVVLERDYVVDTKVENEG